MDSGSSSSMQSSSCGGGGGGEEEYDSRTDQPISAFFNQQNITTTTTTTNNNSHHHHLYVGGGPLPNPPPTPQPLQLHHHHQTHSETYALMSNYFNNNNNTPLLNLDMAWPNNKPVGLESKLPDPVGLVPTAPSSQEFFFTTQQVEQQKNIIPSDHNNNSSSNSGRSSNSNNNMVRNPKKRSRASRRAPTTVLTTDTTNFRAMVQEFTGIPAPPFTGSSSPFQARSNNTNRFDLFGSLSSPNPSSPSYLLRPFAQKLNIPPPFLSSSSSSSFASTSTTHATTSDYQNLLNMKPQNTNNPFFNFHSPKYPFADSSNLATKPKTSIDTNLASDHPQSNVLEEFGHNLGGLQSIVSSSVLQRNDGNNENNDGRAMNYGETAVASSSSSLGAESSVAAVAARSEGMVESWICSSD